MKNHFIRTILISLLTLMFPLMMYGQAVVVKGTVIDQNTGELLPGANVVEVGKNGRFMTGTITDLNGAFILKVSNPNARLNISFIGYQNQVVDVNGKTELKIQLLPSTQEIGAVTVTSHRVQKVDNGFMPITKRELTSSVATIEMKTVEDVQPVTISEAIQGRLSGVDVTMTTGDPGAGASIKIRGTSTINGRNEPLIVLNGIPYDTDINDNFDFTSATEEDYGALVNIAPEDILSIDILKDAAATAIWGSRAANGVLLITTKRGSKGKTIFNLSYKFKMFESPDPVPLLGGPEYVLVQQDEWYNASMDKTGAPPDLSDPYTFWPLQYDPDYKYYYEHSQNTDWIEAVTQTGFTNDVNFSLSGGGEKANYRLSTGYLDQSGTTIGTDFTRLSTRMNLDYHLTEKVLLYSDFSFTQGNKDANNGNIRSMAYKKAPNMAIYNMFDQDTPSDSYFAAYLNSGPDIANYQGLGSSWWNPVALGYEGKNNSKQTRITANIGVRWDIVRGLFFDGYVAYDLANSVLNTFFPQVASGEGVADRGYNKVRYSDSEAYNIQQRSKLVYQKTFNGDHKFTAVGSYDIYTRKSSAFAGSTEMTPSYWIKEFSQPAPLTSLSSGIGRNRRISYIFNSQYSFRDKYFINGGFRVDGSTSFGSGKKWGTFPFVSAAYRISSESFLETATFINDFKLRASFGLNGNAPGSNSSYFSRYGVGPAYIDMQGINPKNIELNNLQWEQIQQQNYGFDFAGFNNSLNVTFDYYYKKTTDMLWSNYQVPSTTGFGSLNYINFGDMLNTGFEIAISVKAINRNNVGLNINFNIARNRNEVLSMPENISLEKINMTKNGNYARKVIYGEPIGSFYGYVYDGVYSTEDDAIAKDRSGNPIMGPDGNPLFYRFDSPNGYIFKAGDAKYRDINFDGLINELDIVKLGDSNPKFHGGFGTNLRIFKSISINTFFHYKYGHNIVNYNKMALENMYSKNNQAVSVTRRWRQPGDVTDIPRALYQYGYNWLGSSRFVEDGSFLRFKTLSVSYALNQRIVRQMHLESLKFYFNIQNIYTWTNYTGQDPEVGVVTKDPFFVAGDRAYTPPPRNMTFGIDVKF